MSHELYYTSLPAGLKPGSNGFCTVAATAGLPGATAQRLEMLSGYRDLYPPGDPRANRNPVAWSHWRLAPGGRAQSVLSRVCSAGMDHTGRANTFAHHLLLDPAEQPPAGPAWLLSQPGMLDVAWSGAPRTIPVGRAVPRADDPPAVCHAWAAATGDAGWAGVLAATAASDLPRVAYLIYDPAAGHDPLVLLRQAMALLPPARRWPVAFATYFTDLPAGLSCHWRCCLAGSPAAKDARRNATSGVVLDLTTAMGEPPETALVRVARSGVAEAPSNFPGTLTLVAAGRSEVGDDDAAESDPVQLTPLPVGTAASGRLTPRRPLAAPLGGSRVLPEGTPPRLPMGEIVDNPRFDGTSVPPPAKPRTWLWVAAFAWPLLVIPGIIAWHVTAESKRNRDLQARYEEANRQIEQLNEAQNDGAAKTKATVATLQQDVSDREAEERATTAKLQDVAGQLKSARAELVQAKADVAAALDKSKQMPLSPAGQVATRPVAKSMAPAPTTGPAPALDVPPDTIVAAVFEDRIRVLARRPIPHFDEVRFLNPCELKAIEDEPVKTEDAGRTKLCIGLKPSAGTTGVVRTCSVRLETPYGLVLDLGPPDSKIPWNTYLPYCGLVLRANGKLVQTIQLDEPAFTLYLSKSDAAINLAPPTGHMPAGCNPTEPDGLNDTWTCGWKSENGGFILTILRVGLFTNGHANARATFDVKFDAAHSTIQSTWTSAFQSLTALQKQADAQVQSAAADIAPANANVTAVINAGEGGNLKQKEQHATDLASARKRVNDDTAGKASAEDESKTAGDALAALRQFKTVQFGIFDPTSGLTLQRVTVKQ